MNNGAFGENFPYSNFHDLNMDWIIKIAKDFLDQYSTIQEIIETGEANLTELTQTGLTELQEKYETLNTLLENWYTTHSSDIANELASALQDINQLLATNTTRFNSMAEEKTNDLLSTIPSDYTALSDAVESIAPVHINLFDPVPVEFGYLSGTGEVTPSQNYVCSEYIDIHNFKMITLSLTHIACWYDANKTFISMVTEMNSLDYDKLVENIPASAYYIRFSTDTANRYTAQVGLNVARNDFVPYEEFIIPNLHTDLEISEKFGIRWTNLFNKNHTVRGYLSGTGGLINNASYFTSGYIPVVGGETYDLSYTLIAGWFTEDSTFISFANNMDTMTTNKKTVAPSNARFIRVSAGTEYLNKTQVGYNIPRGIYNEYKTSYFLPKQVEKNTIVIDKNGSGDYTSFTQAFLENVDDDVKVIVKRGTYDIKQEYIDIFGQTAIENIGSNSGNFQGFQDGIKIHNKHIVFEAGARLRCDWTGTPINNETFRFSILCIYPNVKIEQMYMEGTGINYCIHDDYGTADNTPYTIEYYNCVVIGWNLRGYNCLGGGCHTLSTHIIKDCYFNNHSSAEDIVMSADLRYHNTFTENAEPQVFVSNCYFSNNANFAYYGNQTTIMRVYVNNCYAPKGINKVRESINYDVDNIYLYTWNNQQ